MANGFRVCWNIFPIFFTLLSFACLLVVIISGTTSKNDLADIYFMRINTTDIIPTSVTDSAEFNSIAESLGLRDFYQNSLWGYCDGYKNGTVTSCSKPQGMYVFDPVDIFQSELLEGKSVTIPQSINDDLSKVTTATKWMFALYITAISLAFSTFLVGLTTLCSRRGSICSTCTACLMFMAVAIATIIAQVLFTEYRNVINDTITEFNVSASLGKTMFILSWGATAAAALAFIGFMFGTCCGDGGTRYSRVGRVGRGGREKPVVAEESYPLNTRYYG